MEQFLLLSVLCLVSATLVVASSTLVLHYRIYALLNEFKTRLEAMEADLSSVRRILDRKHDTQSENERKTVVATTLESAVSSTD